MKKLLIIALALLSVSIVRADEGMWLLSKLKPLNIEKMQQMGFKLTAEDIYDVNKPGIKDAIVGLGNAGRPFRHFCSGEIISPNGLMLTNLILLSSTTIWPMVSGLTKWKMSSPIPA